MSNPIERIVYPAALELINDLMNEPLDKEEERFLQVMISAVESYEKAKGWDIPNGTRKEK